MPDTLRFEWDPQKAAVNRAKHKISFEEAVTVFGDPLGRITDDPRHSQDEDRFVLLGYSMRRRLRVVMFVERGEVTRHDVPRNDRTHRQEGARRYLL